MADNKVLQTRIKLKIDTLTKWQEIENNFVPLAGEKIIYQVDTGKTILDSNNSSSPVYETIAKTGDGVHYLKDLPWDEANAADVYAWAKKVALDYNDLPKKLTDELDELRDSIPAINHGNLTIKDANKKEIIYDPTVDEIISLTGADGISVDVTTSDTTNGTITIKGKVANSSELGMVKSGGNVTVNTDGTMTADGVDEADHADKADYANEAGKVTNALTLKVGDTEVVYDGSVEGQVFEVTAAGLGINTPFDFVGITTTKLEDGKDTKPIAIKGGASEYYPVAGDIVILDNTDKEFLYTGSVWEGLGDAAALTDAVSKLEAKTIDAGDELTWSGTLGANPKIDHDEKLGVDFTGTSNSGAATITAGSGEKTINIPKVNVNKFGHVTGISNETVKITIPALTGGEAETADATVVSGVSVDAGTNAIIVQKKTIATNKTASALEVTGDLDNVKIGFKNQNQAANDILFGDETWAGGTSANYVIFDCGTSEINI